MDLLVAAAPLPPLAPLLFSSRFLRTTLLSLRLVAGAAYRPIVCEAGLERWVTAMPPDDNTPIFTPAVLSRLLRVAYIHLGRPQVLLFYTQTGEQMAATLWSALDVADLRAQMDAVPPADQVRTVWTGLIARMEPQAQAQRHIIRDDTSDQLVIDTCPYCLGVSTATQAICLVVARFYEVLLHRLLGRMVVVRETECAAMGGGTRCVFAVRRDTAPTYH